MGQEKPHASMFNTIAAIFREAGARVALVGGYAVNAYQFSRFTDDIDFAVSSNDRPRISEVLSRNGFREVLRTDLFSRYQGAAADSRIVDLLFLDPHTMQRLLADAQETKIAGETFALPSIFHLIALKLHAMRNNPARELVDFVDIVSLIGLHDIDVTDESFKQMCTKFGAAGAYEKILDHFHRR